MEPAALLKPSGKKLASVNDFCANLTIPVEPGHRFLVGQGVVWGAGGVSSAQNRDPNAHLRLRVALLRSLV